MYVLFVRHGHCALPHAIPEEGTLDELGVRQAHLTADALVGQGVERLFSSPYPRAMQTALYISRRIGIPVEIRHRLHEKTGPGERATRREIAAKFPEFSIPEDMPEVWWPDHRETRADVYERVRPVVDEFKSLDGTHERIVAVAHGGANDALVSVWAGAPPMESGRFSHHNCGLTLVSYIEGNSRVHYLNRVDHLASLGKPDIFPQPPSPSR